MKCLLIWNHHGWVAVDEKDGKWDVQDWFLEMVECDLQKGVNIMKQMIMYWQTVRKSYKTEEAKDTTMLQKSLGNIKAWKLGYWRNIFRHYVLRVCTAGWTHVASMPRRRALKLNFGNVQKLCAVFSCKPADGKLLRKPQGALRSVGTIRRRWRISATQHLVKHQKGALNSLF